MKRAAIVLAAVLAGYFLYSAISRSDKAEIQKLLTAVTTETSFEQSEFKTAESMIWAGALADRCVQTCKATVNFIGRDPAVYSITKPEMIQHLTAARKEFSQLAAAFLNPVIQIDGDTAMAEGMARVMGKSFGRSDYFQESHPVRIMLKRERGSWRIASLENLDAIDP